METAAKRRWILAVGEAQPRSGKRNPRGDIHPFLNRVAVIGIRQEPKSYSCRRCAALPFLGAFPWVSLAAARRRFTHG